MGYIRKIPKDIHAILKRVWGYETFRPMQEDIIRSVLSGFDTLGLMPTGGGKSITFQVPALYLEGVTIVVTPLISLMKDQTDNLNAKGIQAVYFHSGQDRREQTLGWERIFNNHAKILYIAPERLRSRSFINEMRNIEVSLIVVDEAHCISQWGYDFRPAYLEIKNLRKLFPEAPALALTATATPAVAADIMRQLGFRDSRAYRMSFSRPNISYVVRHPDSKPAHILHILESVGGSAIVYTRSRKQTRELAEYLQAAGISASWYHAGLLTEEKEDRQNRWKSGEIRVIVATNAFGMGIDKPDVRVVIHFTMPPSLEEYYQEAGRAGRDGLPSYAVLLCDRNDTGLLRRHITEAFPPREEILRTYTRVCTFLHLSIGSGYDTVNEFDLDAFCHTFRLHPRRVKACLALLSQSGYMDFIEETENASRVMITCDKDELYSIRSHSADADLTLQALLRTYPGLFIDYIFINEQTLARKSGLSQTRVYESLLELDRMKVLHYVPRKRIPYIYMPTSMEEERYLVIGRKVYEDRIEILQQRTEAIINYATSDEGCRVSRMLAYFGERDAPPCGSCDICRSTRIHNTPKREVDLVENVIEQLRIHPRGLRIKDLAPIFGDKALEAEAVLRHLCGEGYALLRESTFLNASDH